MVPALGDSDLSTEAHGSDGPLAGLIRAGDPDAIAAFRAARLPRVKAYALEVSAPEQIDDACSAAFADFLARVAVAEVAEDELDELLLAATRSATAGRFAVIAPADRPDLAVSVECYAMPELLAAHANGERASDEGLIAGHLASCVICAQTLARAQEAERAFAQPTGDLEAIEVTATLVDLTKAPPAQTEAAPPQTNAQPPRSAAPVRPPEQSKPQPEPESVSGDPVSSPRPSPAASHTLRWEPAVVRRRSGGLVGAIRRIGRNIRS